MVKRDVKTISKEAKTRYQPELLGNFRDPNSTTIILEIKLRFQDNWQRHSFSSSSGRCRRTTPVVGISVFCQNESSVWRNERKAFVLGPSLKSKQSKISLFDRDNDCTKFRPDTWMEGAVHERV